MAAHMKLADITHAQSFVGDPALAGGVVKGLKNGSAYAQVGKRAFDIVVAVLLLPLVLPLIAFCAILTASDGGRPFYGQTRVGRGGRQFRCWKIRSMMVDAEHRLQQHLSENSDARCEWARDHKLKNDPRITTLGRVLRKSSLDELPQIFNVLRGEMSFVGPRPVVEEELGKYGIYKAGYLAMTPGITGLWQVSGRNDVSYRERVVLDMRYLARSSLVMDIWIMLQTAHAVLNRTGK